MAEIMDLYIIRTPYIWRLIFVKKSACYIQSFTGNICIKIQQTTLADILNNITSKILGEHYHGCPPFINIGGTSPLSHRDRRPCM